MSECVVRMKMPKCCDDCDANYDCCACGIIEAFWFRNPRYKEFDSSKERLPDCPIICQLPEGHGRLVDADAIIEVMKKCAENPENEQALLCYRYVQRILEEALTIVPAERREV